MNAKKKVKATARRIAIAADAALIKAGEAAEQRQHDRAVKAALKKTGKLAAFATMTAAVVAGARAALRARRGRKRPAGGVA